MQEKQMNKVCVLLGSILTMTTLFSCQEKGIHLDNTQKCSGFSKTIEIGTGETIPLSDVGITGFRIIDTLLVVSTNNKAQGYSVYSLPKVQKMGSFMDVGHSTSEVSEIPYISDAYLYKEGRKIVLSFQDSRTGYYDDVDVLQSLQTGKQISTKKEHFIKDAAGNIFIFYHFAPEDFYAVCLDMKELKWIRQYYHNNQQVSIPAMDCLNQYAVQDIGQFAQGSLICYPAFNAQKGIIAEAHWHSNQIHLYSLNGDKATTLIPNGKLDDYLNLPADQTEHQKRIYYKSIKGYADYFMLDHPTPQNENFLQCYDWDGRQLLEMKMPQPYTSFDIDMANHFIYTLDNETEQLTRYPLPKELMEIGHLKEQ